MTVSDSSTPYKFLLIQSLIVLVTSSLNPFLQIQLLHAEALDESLTGSQLKDSVRRDARGINKHPSPFGPRLQVLSDDDAKLLDFSSRFTEAPTFDLPSKKILPRPADKVPAESGIISTAQKSGRCIALSGGGIRSALFALGVLGTFYAFDDISQFDVISSVSGGGYAAGWFLTSFHRRSDAASLSPQEFFSGATKDVGKSIIDEYQGFERHIEDVFYGTESLALAPLGALLSFGRPPTVETVAATNYRWRLERTFLGRSFWRSLLPGNHIPTLKELQTTVAQWKLPDFIFNATVQRGNTTEITPLDRIFEFTPFRFGSNLTGYKNMDDSFTIGDAIALSGAALDTPSANPVVGIARNYSGVTLGRAIEPFRADDAAFYYWLSDGGHIENLGVLSLLKRGCSTIFIADAEEDSNYTFEGYLKMKDLANTYLGLDVHVPYIDTFLAQKSESGIPYKSPVTFGWVNHRDNEMEPTTRIIYLKLSTPDSDSASVSKEMRELLEETIRRDPSFPHYPTLNQRAISKYGMRALFLLGSRYTGVGLWMEENYEDILKMYYENVMNASSDVVTPRTPFRPPQGLNRPNIEAWCRVDLGSVFRTFSICY